MERLTVGRGSLEACQRPGFAPWQGPTLRGPPTNTGKPSARVRWSEQQDSNLRPLAPQANALPGCAMLRFSTARETRPLTSWSGRQGSNLRPPVPETGALPDWATPRRIRGGISVPPGPSRTFPSRWIRTRVIAVVIIPPFPVLANEHRGRAERSAITIRAWKP